MKRRNFLEILSGSGAAMMATPALFIPPSRREKENPIMRQAYESRSDVVIIGGGMDGCAAALSACRNGLKVVMTKETAGVELFKSPHTHTQSGT